MSELKSPAREMIEAARKNQQKQIDQAQQDGYEQGERCGKFVGRMGLAHEVRVLASALIAAHKKEDHAAFWASVSIIKTLLMEESGCTEEEFELFGLDKCHAK